MRTQLVLFAMGAVTLEFASVLMLDAIGGGDGDGCDVEIDDRDGDAVMRGDGGMDVIDDNDCDGGMDVTGG